MADTALVVCAKQHSDIANLASSIERNLSGLFDIVPVIGAESIATGYNRGASMECSVGFVGFHDFLAWAHCDTEFLFPPSAWEDCRALMRKASTGFVGVCGARRLEYDGQQWPPAGYGSGGVMHKQKGRCWYSSFGEFGQTLALDGLFLACHRDVYRGLGGFDEKYPGWHYYDVDMTMRAALKGYANYTFPLLISHGVENFQATQIEEWKKDRAVFRQTWGHMMPMLLEVEK